VGYKAGRTERRALRYILKTSFRLMSRKLLLTLSLAAILLLPFSRSKKSYQPTKTEPASLALAATGDS